MKRYSLSFADSLTHTPEHPERTAKRSISFEVEYQVWPSRGAMLTTIRIQGNRAPSNRDWVPCVEVAPMNKLGWLDSLRGDA